MKNHISKQGLEKLKEELEYLKKDKRKEIAEHLKYAVSFGDLSENAAYDEAREAQEFVERKIKELEKLVRNAIIIENGKSTNKVQIGSTFILKSSEGEEKYTIVGPTEVDPINGKISAESSLGKQVLNLKKGDTFKFKTSEEEIKYVVAEIE